MNRSPFGLRLRPEDRPTLRANLEQALSRVEGRVERLGRVEWCAWYSYLTQACLILENEKKDSLGLRGKLCGPKDRVG